MAFIIHQDYKWTYGKMRGGPDDICIRDMTFKRRFAILPFRCTTTGKLVWPGAKIYVAVDMTRNDPDKLDRICFTRVKMSEAEYSFLKLVGKL